MREEWYREEKKVTISNSMKYVIPSLYVILLYLLISSLLAAFIGCDHDALYEPPIDPIKMSVVGYCKLEDYIQSLIFVSSLEAVSSVDVSSKEKGLIYVS